MVFANEDEASAFTQLPPSQSEESLKVLSELCETAVVKLGAKGTLIAKDNEIIRSEATPVKTVLIQRVLVILGSRIFTWLGQ